MRQLIIIAVTLIALCCVLLEATSGIEYNTGQLIMQYDAENVNQFFHCQQCYDYLLDEDSSEGWNYRFCYNAFIELTSEGSECCWDSCDPEAGTCNVHAVEELPPVLSVQALNSLPYGAEFSGVYDSSSTDPPATCKPPGTSTDFCANFKFTNYILTSATFVNVSTTEAVSVPSQTIRNMVRIDTWPFVHGSKGMRLKYLLTVTNQDVQAWRLWPADEPATSPEAGTFGSVSVETMQRVSNITFSPVARLNGSLSGTPVNISGPYPHQFDPNSRYFYVDVPPFVKWGDVFKSSSNPCRSMEYDVFVNIDFINLLSAAATNELSLVLLSLVLVMLSLM